MYTTISADVELQMLKQYFVNMVDGESQEGPTVAIDLELDISLYFSIRTLVHNIVAYSVLLSHSGLGGPYMSILSKLTPEELGLATRIKKGSLWPVVWHLICHVATRHACVGQSLRPFEAMNAMKFEQLLGGSFLSFIPMPPSRRWVSCVAFDWYRLGKQRVKCLGQYAR